jgi:dipeptidyl aminopeptidase/acylaminoacyl peptidase
VGGETGKLVRRLAVALGLLLLVVAPHRGLAQAMVEAADLYRLSLVTSPVVAPDGRRILFTRAAFDRGLDRRTGELWLAHLDEAGRVIDRRLLVGRDLQPRGAAFDPAGGRIAFIGQSFGRPQVHVLALGEGVPEALTSGPIVPVTIAWSPDGARIAFIGRVEERPRQVPGMPERPAGAEQAPDPKIVADLFWRTDANGELPPGAVHLFVLDLGSGSVTQLTSGREDAVSAGGGLAWTPDGRSLIASVQPDRINRPAESDLFLFDAARPNAKPVQLTRRPGSEAGAAVSPDGRFLAFTGAELTTDFYPMPELWVMEMRAGAPVRNAAPMLDRPVAGFQWREDSGALFVLFHDEGVTRVGEVDLASGSVAVRVPVVGGTRLYLPSAGGDFSHARGTLAYTSAFTDRPAGLGVSRGGDETGAIDFNARWAAARRPARIEEVTVASRLDGRRVQGWIAYPPDFDSRRRYPLILDIHGGPNTDYGPFFSITHALYAAAGYIVLFTNPRGSIGYGREFANLITNAYPGPDHDDLMSAVDAVAARPYVDARNLFIGGGSGGGVLTLWAIGMEPEKFRGAVALRPVTDWVNQVTTSDSPAFFMRQWMGATPWDAPDLYVRRSPFNLAGRIRTPTLFITGEQDFRTPIAQTEQMFGALRLQGVDAEMIRLPGANHGMGRPSQWLQSILAPVDFFNQRRAR